MAKWIGAAQEAEKENVGVPVEEEAARISKWKPVTLAVLFAGQKDSPCTDSGSTRGAFDGGSCRDGGGRET